MEMSTVRSARFQIGQVVRHKGLSVCGVIFDVDRPSAIPRSGTAPFPRMSDPTRISRSTTCSRRTPTPYIAYVSEQNLVPDASDEPLRHPQVAELFEDLKNGIFRFRFLQEH